MSHRLDPGLWLESLLLDRVLSKEIQKLEELRDQSTWDQVLENTTNTKLITQIFQHINTAADDFHVRFIHTCTV